MVGAKHSAHRPQQYHTCWGDAPEAYGPNLPGSALIDRATTNLASGIHHEAYDCSHNEADECAAKLEVGLLR